MANTARCLRILALVVLLVMLSGAGVAGPGGRVIAGETDCGDGHKWDDAQQMCVDQEPSDCVDGQVWDDIQQMCVEAATDNGGGGRETTDTGDGSDSPGVSTNGDITPTPPPAAETPSASLTVTVNACPPTYDFSRAGANPPNDCMTPLDGVQVTYRVPDRPDLQPVQQPATGGTTTFANLVAGAFALDASVQPGAPAPTSVAWTCQGAMSSPVSGAGTSISGQIQDGEQLTCAFYVVVPQSLSAATPATTRASLAGNGTGRGSIRIELSLCPLGFDPAGPPVDLSTVCNKDYSFIKYPITFTAFGTTADTAVVGVSDSFFGWVKFDDNLGPDTYRVEAKLPAGISTVLFEYCGDGGTVVDGTLTFMAPVTAGSNFACGLDAVLDANAPTPTRAPNTNDSNLSIASAVCPAGFVPGATEIDPNRVCTGTQAGIPYSVSGPASLGVAGVDTLSLRATPGVYHVSFTMPEGIASVAGARCAVYDILETHWVDDAVLAPVTTGREVAFDVDVPGAMIWSCAVFVVPTGPSPTTTPTATPTLTVTPTPSATSTMAARSQTTTQGQPSQQTGSQGGPPSASSSGTTSQPQTAQQGGPPSSSSSGPASAGTPTPARVSGSLAIVINAYLCPVGSRPPAAGAAPEGCLTAYPGAVFAVHGQNTGITLQAVSGEILPGAAYIAELPPDDYAITQQAASGIVESFGTCALLDGGTGGSPVTPAAIDGTVQQAFDASARAFVCDWYSVPDETFGGPASPVAPQGVSLTVHAFRCPAGYDPSSADASPATDCLAPARDVVFSLAGEASGTATDLTTGAGATTSQQDGPSHSGTVVFTGLAADSYTLTQGNADGPANAFVSACSLATAQDPDVPIYPTVSQGSIQYQFNDNEALTCLWYIIPPGGPDATAEASSGTTDQPPASDEPSTVYIFTYACPAGYDPSAAGAVPAGDCTEPQDGLSLTLANADGGTSTQQRTGDAFSGGAMFTGVIPATYRLSAALPAGQTVFALPCDVNGAADGSVRPPLTLALSASGETDIAVPGGVTISCSWYIVPSAGAGMPSVGGGLWPADAGSRIWRVLLAGAFTA